MKDYFVYIITDLQNEKFYTGVTNDLARRIYEHKEKFVNSYSKKHNINKLVYYEIGNDINAVIHKEKLIKKWRRCIKIEAINKFNPDWQDLYYSLNA